MKLIFKDVLERIQKHYKHKNDAETARFLDVSAQTLNNWKHRNTPDYKKVIEKCTGMDLHWLLTGEPAPVSRAETVERAEVKQKLATLLVQKGMFLTQMESDEVKPILEEIKVINDALKYI